MRKFMIFQDRQEAGQQLALKLAVYKGKEVCVLGIPNGGVVVAAEVAKVLKLPFNIILVRKIQLPWSTEAGFGACSVSGCLILNEAMIQNLGLTKQEIQSQREKTMEKILERERKYRQVKPPLKLINKVVILIDDGLASGYTMIAACREVKKQRPEKMVVAVPCASAEAVDFVKKEADEIISLNIKSEFPFAVADFYKNWYDVPDEEVLEILKNLI